MEITDCNESVTEIEIPAEIEGLPVKSLNSNIYLIVKNLKAFTFQKVIIIIAVQTEYYLIKIKQH